jgi:hypothetical protein
MRRLVVICAALAALAVPAFAAATDSGTVDGWLVVRNGDNGDGIGSDTHPYLTRPVVTLIISGFVIGHVSEQGRIAIYDLGSSDQAAPEVTGASRVRDLTSANGSDGTMWKGTDFRFRAVDGLYKVVVWGSGVYLFAGGQGNVTLTGSYDTPGADGKYSLNGGDFRSIPLLLAQKPIGTDSAG